MWGVGTNPTPARQGRAQCNIAVRSPTVPSCQASTSNRDVRSAPASASASVLIAAIATTSNPNSGLASTSEIE